MGRTAVLVALVASSVLAGCVGSADLDDVALEEGASSSMADLASRLTQPIYETILREPFSFASFDGTGLYVEVFRPEVPANVTVPVLLVMTPYMDVQDLDGSPYDARLTNYFVPRGYAVAFGNTRGTHNSGGCLPQTDMNQAKDGYEMVEFLAAQPWSSGKVGMYGISYDGETQQSTATLAPPHLVTIVPSESITSQYLWFYQNGVPYAQQWIGMTSYMGIGLTPGHTPAALQSYPERVPCHVENHQNAMEPFHDGRMNDYWDERNWQPAVKSINASVFYLHGFDDWNVKPIHILDWYNEIESPKKAWIGQWPHAWPTREDWTFTLHRWYDHWLMGIDTGLMEEPPVQLQDSLGRWWNTTAFPPPDATPTTFYLRRDAMDSQNRLSPTAPFRAEPPQGWSDARTAFVGVTAGAGPMPARLTYVTEPLQQDLHYAGAPELSLYVSVSRASTHVAAHLYDVAPGGTMTLVNRGYMDTLFRNSLYEPEPLGSSDVALLNFTMNPQDTVFEKGHRIGLALMSLDEYIEQDPSESRVTLYHDAERPSAITLPVVHPTEFHLVPLAEEPQP